MRYESAGTVWRSHVVRTVLMLLCHILLLIMQLRTHYTKYWTEKGHWILTNSPVTLNITLALSPVWGYSICKARQRSLIQLTERYQTSGQPRPGSPPPPPHSHDSLLFAGLKPSQQDSGCLAPAAQASSGSVVMITQLFPAPAPTQPATECGPGHQSLQMPSRTLLLHLLHWNNTITTWSRSQRQPLPFIGARVGEAEKPT